MWKVRAVAAVSLESALLNTSNRRALRNTIGVAIRAFSSSLASSGRFSNRPAVLSHRCCLMLFSSSNLDRGGRGGRLDESEEEEENEDWEEEEEEEVEPKIGDGGDGGGILLKDVAWGERALSIACEVLPQLGEDITLHAFRVSARGYIYVRLDKLTNEYGCPSMEEIETFSNAYKKRLDEIGACGEIPDDLALQVSSPGAERLLRVPDDLDRFKNMPMRVSFSEEDAASERHEPSEKVLLLDSINLESRQCVWKLANVRENRDAQSKGRPLSRKQKDWRLTLPFDSIKRVSLYLDSKTR